MIVCIESCIGGGKGFFLKYLSTYARWAWPEMSHSLVLLDDSATHMTEFSSDRPRWAMLAQLSALLQHAVAQRPSSPPPPLDSASASAPSPLPSAPASASASAPSPLPSASAPSSSSLVLVEGSLFTDFRCSAKRWRAMGLLAPEEFRIVEDWYEIAVAAGARRDAVVYLDNDVHAHFERVVANSKREQAWISAAHLADMKRDYDATLSRESTPTLFIPCAPNFEDNEPELLAMAETTVDFLKKVHLRRLHGAPEGTRR